jgi:hypothetical protein
MQCCALPGAGEKSDRILAKMRVPVGKHRFSALICLRPPRRQSLIYLDHIAATQYLTEFFSQPRKEWSAMFDARCRASAGLLHQQVCSNPRHKREEPARVRTIWLNESPNAPAKTAFNDAGTD